MAAPAAAKPAPKLPEMRCAPDGNFYTEAEFVEFYGGLDEWHDAEELSAAMLSAGAEAQLAAEDKAAKPGAAAPAAANPFAASSPPKSTSASPFAQPGTGGGVFGGVPGAGKSPFGSASGGGVFGAAASSGAIFGFAPAGGGSGIFGAAPTSVTSGSAATGGGGGIFGGANGGIFGTSAGSSGGLFSGLPKVGAEATKEKSPEKAADAQKDDEYVEEHEVVEIDGWKAEITLDVKEKVDTGEEEEEELYAQRSKLFRMRDGEWKERGLGIAKLLKHKESGQIRLAFGSFSSVYLRCADSGFGNLSFTSTKKYLSALFGALCSQLAVLSLSLIILQSITRCMWQISFFPISLEEVALGDNRRSFFIFSGLSRKRLPPGY